MSVRGEREMWLTGLVKLRVVWYDDASLLAWMTDTDNEKLVRAVVELLGLEHARWDPALGLHSRTGRLSSPEEVERRLDLLQERLTWMYVTRS